MTINRNKRVPDTLVYSVIYAVIYVITLWLLGFRSDSPANWILYVAMGITVLAGLSKLAFHSRKGYRRPELTMQR